MTQRGSENRRSARGTSAGADTPQSGGWGWLLLGGLVFALVAANWTLLVAIAGLAFLITVHEFGHFAAAKLFGMRVEKFYVGFPPAVWRRQRGETEYGIGMIPLGGFCRISGMSEEEELPPEVEPRAYYNQPVWKRNLTIFAGPLFNFLIAVVILFVFLLAQGVLTPTLTLEEVVPTITVDGVKRTSPAAEAGLRAGDTLLGGRLVEGSGASARFSSWTEWAQASAFFQDHPERVIELRYRTRQGSVRVGRTTLAKNPADASTGYLGVRAGQRADRPLPWTAAWMAVAKTGDIVVKTFQGFYWLITGKVSASGGAAGPVGIIDISSQAVQQGYYPVLLALLSVNLGVINLVPLLPFDGGHLFFNTLERVRRRKLDRRVMERFAAVGVALLLMLFVFLTFNDLRRLFGG